MFSGLRGRLLVIGGICLMCLWALLGPLLTAEDPEERRPIKLGLDLRGGTHLVLQVSDPERAMTTEARTDAANRAREIIANRIDQFGVREPTIQRVGVDRIIVELAGIQDVDRAKGIIEQTAFLEFKIVADGAEFIDRLPTIDSVIVASLGEGAIPEEARAETAPGLEDLLQQRDSAAATPPSSEAELRPLTRLLLDSGRPGVGIFLVEEPQVETVEEYLELPGVRARIPGDIALHWGTGVRAIAGKTYTPLYVTEAEPLITGEYLVDAQAIRDPQYGTPIVPFRLTRQGGRIFERGTSRHVGDLLAIILDAKVQGDPPVIRDVLGDRAQIELGTGSTLTEAQDIALVLRAGALPAPMEIIEERTVGPSLGQDSIDQGEIAGAIGVALVIVVMIGYYRIAGILSVAGLLIYVLIIMGGLAGLQATLTLPGIAGLILSIGMAVDANVLIFERIREEIEGGKTPRTAVDSGFQAALSAIIDSNLTTLITAIILYQFGTGPVKGFAVTLSIGIVASFFSAVFVVRTFMLIWLESRSPSAELSI